jgi:hypothetical protein
MLRDEVTAIFVNPQSRSQVRSVWVCVHPIKKLAPSLQTARAGLSADNLLEHSRYLA